MQTNFSATQLKDPDIAEADKILRRCVHCGLCTATCPTYVTLKDERDSPRGRIYGIKDFLETGGATSADLAVHIDRCLTCLSCMTTCPSGVDYMHLVDIARRKLEVTRSRRPKDRFVRAALAKILPYPKRLKWALRIAPMGRTIVPLMKRVGLEELAAMAELAPRKALGSARYSGPGTAETKGIKTGRVILLQGCAQQVLRPDINDATIRLLARGGVDVIVSNGSGCCGALTQHMGKQADAEAAARRNVSAWAKDMAKADVDAIVINASGCGTVVKDYGHLLARDKTFATEAKRIADMTLDVTEFLSRHDIGPAKRWSSLKVAYHAACSLQHGQRITHQPKTLLRQAGFTVLDIAEGHLCCGSAGVYNILQPKIATELRDRKTTNIKALRPDVVATGNIGCISQLQSGLDIPVVHTVELLDWAYGGPTPRGLEALEKYVTNVPQATRSVDDYIAAQ
jgi:glycolate oxidase iron-sulfur subunit